MVRQTVRNAVPAAEETISYQMPTIMLDGRPLMCLAGWKHQVSLYPAPTGDETFEEQIAPYRAAKGTVRFPLSKPIPYDIERVANLHLEQRLDSSSSG